MDVQNNNLSRRGFIKTSAVGIAAGSASLVNNSANAADETEESETKDFKGRIKQSVCKWCFGSIPMDQFAAYAAKIGIRSIELVGPSDWPTLKKHGLICAMSNSHGITKGLNRTENHDECLDKIRKSIEETADAGFPNVICFSGNREGMDDDEGMKNCETAIKKVVGLAEQKGITICLELLNSKRNHKDYMCDRTHWGGKLVRKIGSPNFKLLYDIYHMQVQEGDVIATIREYKDCIGHYHTAGVPGRNEIDETQELYYPTIMKTILETGFDGYVAQEFVPKRDPLESLAQAVKICDV